MDIEDADGKVKAAAKVDLNTLHNSYRDPKSGHEKEKIR